MEINEICLLSRDELEKYAISTMESNKELESTNKELLENLEELRELNRSMYEENVKIKAELKEASGRCKCTADIENSIAEMKKNIGDITEKVSEIHGRLR